MKILKAGFLPLFGSGLVVIGIQLCVGCFSTQMPSIGFSIYVTDSVAEPETISCSYRIGVNEFQFQDRSQYNSVDPVVICNVTPEDEMQGQNMEIWLSGVTYQGVPWKVKVDDWRVESGNAAMLDYFVVLYNGSYDWSPGFERGVAFAIDSVTNHSSDSLIFRSSYD